jgi:hypothetical protein
MRHRRRTRYGRILPAVIVGLLGSGVLTLAGSYAAFSSTTSNPTSNWSAGTVTLTDDDGGSAMFTTSAPGTGQTSAAGMKPGQSVVNCIKVTYSGSLPSTVKLYGSSITETSPGGTGMLSYLHVKVEEGTGGAFGCSGFTGATTIWDTATHPGVASDLLGVFPTTYAAGVSSGLASWTTSSTRTYRFTITLDNATPDTSQGATAAAVFNWQAQNS